MESCKPTVCDRDKLLSGDLIFMNKELIKKNCSKCLYRSLCLQVVDLLDHWHWNNAEKILNSSMYNEENK